MTTLVTFDCGAGIELVSPVSVSDIIVEHLAVFRTCPTDRELEVQKRKDAA